MTETSIADPGRLENFAAHAHPALAVEAKGLTFSFWKQRALDQLDLSVPEGAAYLLVGPNGAGKTTTLKLLLNLLRAKEGWARVFGKDTRTRGAEIRAEIGWVPESPETPYAWAKVSKLLQLHGAYYGGWDEKYAARLLSALGVGPTRRVGMLSKGQKRSVQLVMAMAHKPRLLLLDEPLEGLDPVVRETVTGLLTEHMAEHPTTLFVSTHLIHEIDRLADHVGVIREGRLIFERERTELDEHLRRYLAVVPEDWGGLEGMGDAVIGTIDRGREREWTVWGEEGQVLSRLQASGAVVRRVSSPTLEEAVVALVKNGGPR